MSDGTTMRDGFTEPKPDEKFMLLPTGETVTYAQLLERTGERPTSERELEELLEQEGAAAIRAKA